MAQSPAHRFGQIIGDALEAAVRPLMQDFASRHNLYLDQKGYRPARGKKTEVKWIDLYGNEHKLDFVLERDGTPQRFGTPVAFIETAWRRYTKHSRNKAQEIQGAVLPLVATHENAAPFIGAILAGVFTEGALTQMRSLGFNVLYFPYESMIEAFATVGIDARFGEDTPDPELAATARRWKALSQNQREGVTTTLIQRNRAEVERFVNTLDRAVSRQIESIRVLPLHGAPFDWESVDEAIEFVQDYNEMPDSSRPIVKYEIEIRYTNGDQVRGQFSDKLSATNFLRSFQPPLLKPAE